MAAFLVLMLFLLCHPLMLLLFLLFDTMSLLLPVPLLCHPQLSHQWMQASARLLLLLPRHLACLLQHPPVLLLLQLLMPPHVLVGLQGSMLPGLEVEAVGVQRSLTPSPAVAATAARNFADRCVLQIAATQG